MRSLFLLCMAAATLTAQDSSSSSTGSGSNISEHITAAGEFFDHDFLNFYAYGNGVWDSRVPSYNSTTGVTTYGGGLGWEAGGGITATHAFKGGGFTINYRGSYRDYQSTYSGSGQQQSISLGFNKQLNRQWSFGANAVGGILGSGSSFYSATSALSTTPGNPLSIQSRFASVGLSLTYAQTRRLSYVFSGDFMYNGYKTSSLLASSPLSSPVSTRGVTGAASVLYRLTKRTTIGGNYARTYYAYSAKSGTTNIDSVALSLSHLFGKWQIDLSGGVNHTVSVGRALTPIKLLDPTTGNVFIGYFYIPYDRTIFSPAYQGNLTRYLDHSSISLSAGQSVLAGNGLYLASRNQFVNGTYSYTTVNRRSNLSLGFNYSRLSSVSTADLAQTYSYYGASAAYGFNLATYLSANLRYDLLHYSNVFNGSVTGQNATEQRISFGLSLSSQKVPLTLF